MLSSVMEQTALRLMQHDFNSYPINITSENLDTLKETCNNEFLNDIIKSHPIQFKGFFIINIDVTSSMHLTCENQYLTTEDFESIEEWAILKKITKYTLDYYRIDTPIHILLFNLFQLHSNRILHGLVFDNTIQAKLNLVQFKQNNLMRDFI